MTKAEDTICRVTTFQVFSEGCTIDLVNKIITVKDVFPTDGSAWSGPIIVTLEEVQNPINNKNLGSFTIATYADQDQTYIVDSLAANLMFPRINCDYPCATCSLSDRTFCETCWQDDLNDPQYLMDYGDTATCKAGCDSGYSANAATSDEKICYACDESCDKCLQSDVRECIDCALPKFPFRLTQSNFCFADCGLGKFQSTNTTCSLCLAPCFDCFGTESKCTQCDPNSTFPVLCES
jgi:hypothetical protein